MSMILDIQCPCTKDPRKEKSRYTGHWTKLVFEYGLSDKKNTKRFLVDHVEIYLIPDGGMQCSCADGFTIECTIVFLVKIYFIFI